MGLCFYGPVDFHVVFSNFEGKFGVNVEWLQLEDIFVINLLDMMTNSIPVLLLI